MTDFEKLVYILNEEGYSNNDIANFLNTSHSSIRSVKVKIQKKIQKNGFE
jgi:DNA-binding NarL/FixJ family response regulator